MNIPVEDIAVVDRGREDLGDIPALAANMRQRASEGLPGQMTAGVVRRSTPADLEKYDIDPAVTPFVLVAGERRYRACVLAGFDTFRADDFGELSPLQRKIVELEENLNRKDMTWAEEVLLKDEINELRKQAAAEQGKTFTQKELAVELKETPANTSRDLKLAQALKADPSLAQAGGKVAAMRQLEFQKSVETRIARVGSAPMKRVEERLVTADMRTFVRTIKDKSIDLTFTDFPFGIDYKFTPDDRNKYEDSQEALMDLLTDVVPQIIRVTKPTGWLALMMGSTNYEFLAGLVRDCCATHYEYRKNPDGKLCRHPESGSSCRFLTPEDPEWIWFRPNSRNPSMWPEKHAQNQYEKICVVNMGEAVLIKKNLGNVLVHDAIYEDRIHEMQRPHSLCLDVVSRLTVGGERVLDLCFGSGSALAAAAELQRDFIGCDLNPKNLEPALMFVAEHMERPING